MTNKEQKNIFVLVLTIGLLIVSIWQIIDTIIPKQKYTVDQYVFQDGSKITVDWNKYTDSTEYKNVRYYFGCINDGIYADNWFMSAEQWYKLIYERGGENYAQYGATLTEWRW